MVFRAFQDLLPKMIFGQHIQRHDIGPAVVVYVGDIRPHGRIGRMRQHIARGFDERPVPAIHVQIIVLDIVVGNIQIGPAVPVHVARNGAKPETQRIPDNARRFARVRKAPAVVPVQFVACKRVARSPHILHVETAQAPDRMIQEVHIQVAVPVVIEEDGVVRIRRIVQAVLSRPFGKRPVPVVDVQGVPATTLADPARFAHIYIQMAVPVRVRHDDAGRPA